MKKQLLFLALLNIISIQSFSQIIFESGYFVNENSEKMECLIKNIDWKNNPTDFEYKLTENASVQKANINSIKEFEIKGVSKYSREIVKIDRSSDRLENLSSDRNPVFTEEQLFLKLIIDGKAKLYSYVDGNLTRFYYQLENSGIHPLIYKRYMSNQYIKENNLFRQQLFSELKCAARSNVKNLKYVKRDLRNFFVKYNECIDSEFIDYEATEKKDLFNLSLRAD